MAVEGVLFWLEAINVPARQIIDLDANSFYKVDIRGRKVLRVGLQTNPKVSGRVISLGRDPASNDLLLPDRIFSKNHCHFYFNRSSSALILRDTSSTKSTQVRCLEIDDDSTYRLQGDPRQRVLLMGHQMIMQIGPAQFRIVWRVPKEPGARQALEQAKAVFARKQIAPELDLTFLDLQSLPSTAYELRSHYTPSVASQYQKLPKIVHETQRLLGSGSFGTVHKTVDLDTGNLLAVKTSNHGVGDSQYKKSLKQEVEILAKLSHPNIVKFTHSQGWASGSPVEIFMSLHEGNLTALIPPHNCDGGIESEPYFCTQLVMQVLHAVAYLHGKGIIHRDIKPENILYDHNGKGSSLTFYISDFGLSKEQSPTSSMVPAGTPLYIAPEINQGKLYTNKCDIWSFAVMMLWVLGYFCLEEPDLPPEKWKDRMARLPRYRSNLTFEASHGPAASLSSWRNQLRWYGRLRSLTQHKMVPPLLIPLLSEDVETRLDAQQCLSLFFPEQPVTTPNTPQPRLGNMPHAPLPSPRIRAFRQNGLSLVQRSRNSRKYAVPIDIVVTAPRAGVRPNQARMPRSVQGPDIFGSRWLQGPKFVVPDAAVLGGQVDEQRTSLPPIEASKAPQIAPLLPEGCATLQWEEVQIVYNPSEQKVNATHLIKLGVNVNRQILHYFLKNRNIPTTILRGSRVAQGTYVSFKTNDAQKVCERFDLSQAPIEELRARVAAEPATGDVADAAPRPLDNEIIANEVENWRHSPAAAALVRDGNVPISNVEASRDDYTYGRSSYFTSSGDREKTPSASPELRRNLTTDTERGEAVVDPDRYSQYTESNYEHDPYLAPAFQSYLYLCTDNAT